MRTLIVILSYNTGDLVIDGLHALDAEMRTLEGVEVVVADNASPDRSGEKIAEAIVRERFSWARFVPLPKNGGFAYGNNAVIRPALNGPHPPDFVLLLNPDTIVRPGAIGELLQYAEKHPSVGICGSRLEDHDGTAQCSAFRFPTVGSELETMMSLGLVSKLLSEQRIAPPARDEPHETDWVAGASMLIRREVLESIGLLDEDYFLYFEEVDFCLRARRAGWRCEYFPGSRIVHLVGQSTGVTDTKRKLSRRPAYWFESRKRYFLKNHGRRYAALADLAFVFGCATYRVRERLQNKPPRDPPKLLRDFLKHSVLFGR